MTEKANPSINRPAEAFKTAGAIAYGGHGESGFVVDGASPSEISLRDSGISDSNFDTFDERHGVELDVSGEDTGVSGVNFNNDGTLLYIVGFGSSAIYEYALGTAYDITTASLNDSLDLTASLSSPSVTGMEFNGDGTKFFITDSANSQIAEYALSTAYDVSTGSLNDTTDVSAQDSSPQGIDFNNDGTVMYVVGSGNASIYEYSLGTAYDASTLTLTDSLDVSGQDSAPFDVLVTDSGNRLYVIGATNDNIYQYSLGTAYDVSTATFQQSYDVSTQASNPTGIEQFDSGSEFVVSDSDAASVFSYPLEVSWDITTATYSDTVIQAGEAFVFGSWLAIDTKTTVDLAASTNNQTVYVGWNKNGTNDVIIGLDTAFESNASDTDQKIPIWTFDTDGSGVTSVIDDRTIGHTLNARYYEDNTTVSSDYTTSGEQVIFADSSGGPVTVTLSTSDTDDGNQITVVDLGGSAGTNNITVATEGSENIDGTSTKVIESNYSAVNLKTDGNNWFTAGGGTGGATRQTANIPLTTLDNGDIIVGLRLFVPASDTLNIYEVGVRNDAGNSPAGLDIEVRDVDAGSNVVDSSQSRDTGEPLGSISGATDVEMRINNNTGGTDDASGYVVYAFE